MEDIAQSVRALVCGTRGRGFESHYSPGKATRKCRLYLFFPHPPPLMSRILAISDIHGCAKTFEALLDRVALSTSDTLYLLGDFIDRGPDSKGVFDLIFQLTDNGYNINSLMGNHEAIMLTVLEDPYTAPKWGLAGGVPTLNSFNARSMSDIPETYLKYVAALPDYFDTGDFIFVHAGLNFLAKDPLGANAADDLKWIRNWYDSIRYDWLGQRIIIHGHTPVPSEETDHQLALLERRQYINIDNGCVFKHRAAQYGMGKLTALDLTNRTIIRQTCIDTVTVS